MVYTHNGILFTLKKEGHSDACYNMNKPWRHAKLKKKKKPVTKDRYWMILLQWVPREWSNS